MLKCKVHDYLLEKCDYRLWIVKGIESRADYRTGLRGETYVLIDGLGSQVRIADTYEGGKFIRLDNIRLALKLYG